MKGDGSSGLLFFGLLALLSFIIIMIEGCLFDGL